MANPGYPPGMQPPMGGPPMGGPPMGGPPMQPPPRAQAVRKGTSKAVPIVVSAGLAIGTFCGLLFGLGTGPDDAVAEPAKSGKNGKDPDLTMEPSKVTDPGTPKIDPPKTASTPPSGSAAPASGSAAPASGSAAPAAGSAAPATGSATTTVAAGSGAPPSSGSGAGSAAPTVPAVKVAKLTIEVSPEAAAKDVKISIDKKDITGLVSDVELGKDGKKTVALTVKSSGYHSVNDQKVEIDGDMTVKIEMKKKAAQGGTGLPRPGGKKDGKSGKTGGGGLIDI